MAMSCAFSYSFAMRVHAGHGKTELALSAPVKHGTNVKR
jgi:hypothetical protein